LTDCKLFYNHFWKYERFAPTDFTASPTDLSG
jgi:hypothetical protein